MTGEGLTAAEREALEATHPSGQVGCNHAGGPGHCAVTAAVEAILTAHTAQAEARGREAALREAARELPGFDGIRTHVDDDHVRRLIQASAQEATRHTWREALDEAEKRIQTLSDQFGSRHDLLDRLLAPVVREVYGSALAVIRDLRDTPRT